MARRLSRRSALRAGFAGTGLLLAGCLGGDNDSETTTTTSEPGSAFADVSFDGGDLVVGLPENHDVSRLNLIAPDGSTYTGADVPVGETTTRLTILDIREGVGGYEHYEPGRYELVGVTTEGSRSMRLDLEPDLRVREVRQYRDGSSPEDFGKVAVDIENVGTGPTWVYDITYRGAPNSAANSALVSDPGVPQLGIPSEPSDLVLVPGSERTYVGTIAPYLFSEGSGRSCSGEFQTSVVIGTPVEEPIEIRISSRIQGEAQPVGLVDRFTCDEVSIDVIERAESIRPQQVGGGENGRSW